MIGLIPTEHHPYSLRDVVRGLAAAGRGSDQPAVISLPGIGDGVAIRSARAAMIISLKALGLPPGAKVGVPLYCCPVVFKAIKAADCIPKFIDIEADSHCLSTKDLRAKRSGLAAVIAVHMFGNVCDMPLILEIMAGKPVIEDCAQSIGSKLGGKSCGSFGEVSFFSFRSGKYLAIGEGAALYSGNANLRARLTALTAALPVPTPAAEIRHVGETYLRSKLRSRRLWGPVGSRIWAAYNQRTDFGDKSPIVLGRMFASDLATLRQRLPQLDAAIASQRAHAAFFERNLDLAPAQLPIESAGAFLNRLMYPIVFPSTGLRDAMAGYLRRHGIGTSSPYEDAVEGARAWYGYEGDCPAGESILKRTLVVPGSHALRSKDIERITRCLNDGWSLVKGTGRS